jgi:hypothetical protein
MWWVMGRAGVEGGVCHEILLPPSGLTMCKVLFSCIHWIFTITLREIIPVLKMRTPGTETVSDLTKVTQLVSNLAGKLGRLVSGYVLPCFTRLLISAHWETLGTCQSYSLVQRRLWPWFGFKLIQIACPWAWQALTVGVRTRVTSCCGRRHGHISPPVL